MRAIDLGVFGVIPRLSEIGKSRKYRLFFIGYTTAWFFAGVAIELVGTFSG